MREYKDKSDLLSEINISFDNFVKEFDNVNPEDFNLTIDGVDKTPHQMISYQIGWLKLLVEWDSSELNGNTVITPHPDFKWNRLGDLYQSFYNQTSGFNKDRLISEFIQAKNSFVEWVSSLSEEELFKPKIRKWATTASLWPLYKWIHINSVAPFTNFKAKIRKWKKLKEV